jgi:hypothetical protein
MWLLLLLGLLVLLLLLLLLGRLSPHLALRLWAASLQQFPVFLEVVSYNGRDHATSCSLHKKIQREDGATCCDTHPMAPLVQENHRRAK